MTRHMQVQGLDFASDDSRAGFRLQRIEAFNWGTFHNRVWSLDLAGENGLLTGDIGSGKSTLVDAMTTLLVPAQKVAYNKAAGADNKERSLRSYVLGYYKSERGDSGHNAKPVALRDHNSYSVILAVFTNEGYDQTITLAQVFWQTDRQGQPERFYCLAEGDLSIKHEFAGFGSDLKQLRKRLRQRDDTQVFETFPPYEAAFRRYFGIDNDQAMDLFHQTVSMKSVGNLTEFVREHMLEAFDVAPRIDALIHHFDDLNRAHEAVLKARAQVEALTPLVEDCRQHAGVVAERRHWESQRDALKPYFAQLKGKLLEQRLERLAADTERKTRARDQERAELARQRGDRDRLREAISRQGGDRLGQLKAELAEKETLRQRRRHNAERYASRAAELDLPPRPDLDTFIDNLQQLRQRKEGLESTKAELQNQLIERTADLRQHKESHQTLSEEIDSLRQRRSNISANPVRIRQTLCEALGLEEDDLPFAGELIRVRDDAADWEGAAERVMHNFALSLMVPDRHYAEVAAWVNKTHLRGRLVYFRVREARAAPPPDLHPDSLVHKLEIKPDSEFYPWLEQELAKRFDYACCDTLDRFRREVRAITATGQIKAGDQRHEKDDRHRLDDRSRYVLGWSNEAKIHALENQRDSLERTMQEVADQIADLGRRQNDLAGQRDTLIALLETQEFDDIDWGSVAGDIARLQDEKEQLEAASDQLLTLTRQLETLEGAIRESDGRLEATNRDLAVLESKASNARDQLTEAQALIDEGPDLTNLQAALDALRERALGSHQLTVESCANREQALREWLQAEIDKEAKRLQRLEERVLKAMNDYCHAWPLDTQEVDVSLNAAAEYEQMLAQLQADDLPRFEQKFKALLNENTIREIAGFQSQLNKERQQIRERIDHINRSLADIQYNPGRYILLEAQPNTDPEVRDFQEQLRACTEDSYTGAEDDQYAESKFLQVRAIIERFRGREGTSDLDKRWTRKVTDVRQWFAFAASERWQEDDSECEHYTDSGGKSGGQKEKLAYTVLAASLAYQFGLEWGAVRSRSFRFVMIDEAFGRGSDESARFGLELFKRLNLQLLIVTPLQKIHIIEPYVAHVGFVYNPEGRESLLRNLSIEAYRAERDKAQA